MIVGRHAHDGRVILLAKDRGLEPMLRSKEGRWHVAKVADSELDAFVRVMNKVEQEQLLQEALAACQPPPVAA